MQKNIAQQTTDCKAEQQLQLLIGCSCASEQKHSIMTLDTEHAYSQQHS